MLQQKLVGRKIGVPEVELNLFQYSTGKFGRDVSACDLRGFTSCCVVPVSRLAGAYRCILSMEIYGVLRSLQLRNINWLFNFIH